MAVASAMSAPSFSPRDENARRETIHALMAEHGAKIHAQCVRTLQDRTLADDVVQQVFVQAYRDLDQYEPRASIQSWLAAIARHRCLDALRARYRQARRLAVKDNTDKIPDQPPSVEAQLDATKIMEALAVALSDLPLSTRVCVLLHYQDGLSYQEIAQQLGVRPATLQARVRRAMPLLRAALERRGFSP
jgi:RNA polymerase sigma-70 factor (ECF subfamily)